MMSKFGWVADQRTDRIIEMVQHHKSLDRRIDLRPLHERGCSKSAEAFLFSAFHIGDDDDRTSR